MIQIAGQTLCKTTGIVKLGVKAGVEADRRRQGCSCIVVSVMLSWFP